MLTHLLSKTHFISAHLRPKWNDDDEFIRVGILLYNMRRMALGKRDLNIVMPKFFRWFFVIVSDVHDDDDDYHDEIIRWRMSNNIFSSENVFHGETWSFFINLILLEIKWFTTKRIWNMLWRKNRLGISSSMPSEEPKKCTLKLITWLPDKVELNRVSFQVGR